MNLESYIRDVPNFPRPGIVFKDLTPLFANGPALRAAVSRLADPWKGRVDVVLGIEARGFILGAAVAYHLGTGLALVRKPGKLPSTTLAETYDLEYGSDRLEIHEDGFPRGSRVLVVDDLLATGGTASAAISLARRLGGTVVAAAFLVELAFLSGRGKLAETEIFSLITYKGE